MKFSEINGGVAVQFDPTTDVLMGVRTIDGIAEDKLFNLPPIAASGDSVDAVPGAGAGVGASVTAGKTNAGVITLTTGASAGVGTLVTATYPAAFANGSSVVLTPANAAAAEDLAKVYVAGTAAGFVLSAQDALTDATQYKFNYLVVGD